MAENDDHINLKDFLDERVGLIRNDYFQRNKDSRELIKTDLGFPETAFSKLEEMCK
jgi:hypothetical protein